MAVDANAEKGNQSRRVMDDDSGVIQQSAPLHATINGCIEGASSDFIIAVDSR